MKAKVKSSGEIIEVKEWRGASDVVYSTIDMNTFYQAIDLDLNLDPPQPEATISGWVARDTNGAIGLHFKRPHRAQGNTRWYSTTFAPKCLPRDSFPSLTWQDEPIEVEITIKPKKS